MARELRNGVAPMRTWAVDVALLSTLFIVARTSPLTAPTIPTAASAAARIPSTPFLWDRNSLDWSRQQASGALFPVASTATFQARAALSNNIKPVVEKPAKFVSDVLLGRPAPSGASHFYMSVARYYWPCNALPAANVPSDGTSQLKIIIAELARNSTAPITALISPSVFRASCGALPQNATYRDPPFNLSSSSPPMDPFYARGPLEVGSISACSANGLPWVFVDGKPNPVSQLYDNVWMSNMVVALRRAMVAIVTSNVSLANRVAMRERACSMMKSFFVNSSTLVFPDLTYAQCVPGTLRGGGIIDFSFSWTTQQVLDAMGILLSEDGGCSDKSLAPAVIAWMRKFKVWLDTSSWGIIAFNANNNIATSYHALRAHLCLFIGDRICARSILLYIREILLPAQVAPSGVQPQEVKRVDGISYSLQNLRTLLQLAKMDASAQLRVNLWRHVTPSGASIRSAVKYLMPYVTGSLPWPCSQSSPPSTWRSTAAVLFRWAAIAWKDPSFEATVQRLLALGAASDALLQTQLQLEYPLL